MQLQLYPNPSAELTRILSLNDDLLDCSIRCLDILGKEHSIEVISKSQMECVLNVQSLVNGNYILEITSENGLSSLPLIIAK